MIARISASFPLMILVSLFFLFPYLIEKGYFPYNKSYSRGYPMGAFKRLDDLDKAVVTTLYICFSLKKMLIQIFLLNSFEGDRTHGLLNISLGDFFSLKLKIPSLQEQQVIAKILNKVDEEIQNTKPYLTTFQTPKKA